MRNNNEQEGKECRSMKRTDGVQVSNDERIIVSCGQNFLKLNRDAERKREKN